MKQKIKKDLVNLQDKKYREFHSSLCPGTDNMIGIKVPILRNYAKELLKQYEFKDLIENIDEEYYEEILLQGILISLAKEDFDTIIKEIENFVPKIDNWAVCDIFCAGLKITKKNKEKLQLLQSDKDNLEKFAREQYMMKKSNEDIFVVVE